MFKELFKFYIINNLNVILDVTFLIKQTWLQWVKLVKKFNYKIIGISINTSLNIILKQNQQRIRQVPQNVIKLMFKKYKSFLLNHNIYNYFDLIITHKITTQKTQVFKNEF